MSWAKSDVIGLLTLILAFPPTVVALWTLLEWLRKGLISTASHNDDHTEDVLPLVNLDHRTYPQHMESLLEEGLFRYQYGHETERIRVDRMFLQNRRRPVIH